MSRRATKVFLSYTSELARNPPERSFVHAAIAAARHAGYLIDDMQLLTAVDQPVRKWCEERVLAADIYVGLIGLRWGSPLLDEPSLSHTELEYQTATKHSKPRLVFLLDENATQLPVSISRDLENGRLQEEFRQRILSGGVVPARFATPEQLEMLLYKALASHPDRPAPFMAPPLSPSFVPRSQLAERLLSALTAEPAHAVGLTTALRGAGGFGKTTMATWLCHQSEIRDRFPDGVLWVDLGEDLTTHDLTGRIADLCDRLSGERPAYTHPSAAGDYLGVLLGDRRMLVVIDDLWNPRDLSPFLRGGPSCVRLITTRNARALPDEVDAVVVDAMTPAETAALLIKICRIPRRSTSLNSFAFQVAGPCWPSS